MVQPRHFLAVASAVAVLRIVVACSTGGRASPAPEAGPPGEAFTACQIQGYISETDGGLCPEETCPVLAFDTNGARIPCCTSVVSGPGMCVDAMGSTPPPDGAAEDAEPGEDGEAGAAETGAEPGADASADASDGAPVDSAVDAATPEAGSSADASDAE